ncbi:hypothetical protein [Myxococcus sp. CA039A]|uniref:hypothetical protein n=1 Tax=Myxococcus sp. CA039A TaxID=2741737 RepID=UPI00157A843B|nr:hypothetical protein [Myxococcus sp. CA039A]NTX54768.1 hypothetical protein [Myxococcus sp. CA039A]
MKKLNLSALLLTLLVAACGGSSGTGLDDVPESEGVIQVPLITTGTGGQTFRLVGATFDITGPKNHTITDTSADTVAVQLPAGGYTIQLQGEWHIERVGAPGQSIPATLISPNPLSFTVAEGEARTVRFLFKTPAEGTTDVGFSVDTGGWLAGTLDFTGSPIPPSSELYELTGKTVPFAISFESAQVRQGNDSSFGSHLMVTTSPVSVQFGGAYSAVLNERVARTCRPTNSTSSSFREAPRVDSACGTSPSGPSMGLHLSYRWPRVRTSRDTPTPWAYLCQASTK